MARLGFSTNRHLPSVRVQPRAEYLHSVGPAGAVDSFRRPLHPDIAAKGTGWWVDVWGERYVAGTPVHRVEVEVGQRGLVELGLDTPTEVLEAAGDIWSYGTGQWPTHRTPTCDRTRSRWPISPEWTAVQRATLEHRPVPLERLRRTRRVTSIRSLRPGLNGYLAAFAAHAGTHDIENTLTSGSSDGSVGRSRSLLAAR